jgi:hypothetical protein
MKNQNAELGGVGDDGSDVASCVEQGTNRHAYTFSKKASL